MKRGARVALAAAVMTISAAAAASETVTYSYDALGRLVGVSTSGTVNDGLNISTDYDPAGNRCRYSVGLTAPPAESNCGAGGANQPPAAVNDSGSMTRCVEKSFAVLANDSDPDGNLPLSLTGVSGGGSRGTPEISGTSILFTPTGLTGTATVDYVVSDSLGATDSATLTISITDGSCGPQQ